MVLWGLFLISAKGCKVSSFGSTGGSLSSTVSSKFWSVSLAISVLRSDFSMNLTDSSDSNYYIVLSQAESIGTSLLGFWCFKKIMNYFNYFNQNIQGHLSAKVNKLGIIVAKANLFQETKFCAIIFTYLNRTSWS